MPASGKKSRSRQAFEAIFEQQTRRFSAFDLLGLSSEVPSPSSSRFPAPNTATEGLRDPQPTTEPVKHLYRQRVAKPESQTRGFVPDRQTQGLQPDRSVQEVRLDRQVQEYRPDGLADDQTVDPKQDQTVDGQSLGQTVWPSIGQTPPRKGTSKLVPDRLATAQIHPSDVILLAPLQWEVWIALQDAEAAGRTTSYRQLAERTNSTIDGVRKAVRVLQKEGGILVQETVRTAHEQGFQVRLNREITFRRGTLNEAKAILKRGLSLGQTPDRQTQILRPDGLRLFVCKNINIKQTDVAQLLRIPPPEWEIREQTLVQIAETLPEMTAIEFRLSLVHLVNQAHQSKEPIRNYNAWIRAAFEKSRAPLVTEREIEARFEQKAAKLNAHRSQIEEGEEKTGLEVLRRYLACSADERAEIERLAEEKTARWRMVVSEDKRPGLIEEARLEAVREFFAKKV